MSVSVHVIGQGDSVTQRVTNAAACNQVDGDDPQNKAAYRILVVDTNKRNEIDQTIVGYLTGYGYTILTAQDHNEAFEIFQMALASEPFHLVITNLKRDERDEALKEIKDGAELIRRIKEISPDTKVLLYTASPPESTQADNIIEKPCKQDKFIEIVAQLLAIQDLTSNPTPPPAT